MNLSVITTVMKYQKIVFDLYCLLLLFLITSKGQNEQSKNTKFFGKRLFLMGAFQIPPARDATKAV